MIGDALSRAGIEPRHLRPGTQRLACPQCQKPRDGALALTIESDGHAVWYCHRCGFKGGTSGNAWRDDLVRERARIEGPRFVARRSESTTRADERLNASLSRAESAARRAREIWASAGPARADHPYLTRKHVAPDGLRTVKRFAYSASGSIEQALLVPLRDESGAVANLQGIDPDGVKRFLAGGRTRGLFACVGAWRREVAPEAIAIGEGWATVAAFLRGRGHYCGIATMSAGNLLAVAEIIRAKFPSAALAILGDQDDAGVRASVAAALAVKAEVIYPGFRHRSVNDFADIHA